MGKTGKWIRNFLTGKKDLKEKPQESRNDDTTHRQISGGYEHRPTTPISIPQQPTTPKEKRRWSFRRSSATAPGRHDLGSADNNNMSTTPPMMDHHHHMENDTKKHALAVAVATAAAADAAVAAAKAAAAVIQLTSAASGRASAVEEDAATRIQSVFRGYLV